MTIFDQSHPVVFTKHCFELELYRVDMGLLSGCLMLKSRVNTRGKNIEYLK